jgi:hypothetical protein
VSIDLASRNTTSVRVCLTLLNLWKLTGIRYTHLSWRTRSSHFQKWSLTPSLSLGQSYVHSTVITNLLTADVHTGLPMPPEVGLGLSPSIDTHTNADPHAEWDARRGGAT